MFALWYLQLGIYQVHVMDKFHKIWTFCCEKNIGNHSRQCIGIANILFRQHIFDVNIIQGGPEICTIGHCE